MQSTKNFNPRTHMGCDYTFDEVDAAIKISIHAPHTGCDYGRGHLDAVCWHISIHAPHTGCDFYYATSQLREDNFNPRTPHGVRLCSGSRRSGRGTISIHAPHTGCDKKESKLQALRDISIHAPHTGCDRSTIMYSTTSGHFNPRTPHGVRLAAAVRGGGG